MPLYLYGLTSQSPLSCLLFHSTSFNKGFSFMLHVYRIAYTGLSMLHISVLFVRLQRICNFCCCPHFNSWWNCHLLAAANWEKLYSCLGILTHNGLREIPQGLLWIMDWIKISLAVYGLLWVSLSVFLGWGLYNIMAESCAHESCHFKCHDHKLTRKGHYCPPFILQNYDDNIGLPDRDARSSWVAMFVCL